MIRVRIVEWHRSHKHVGHPFAACGACGEHIMHANHDPKAVRQHASAIMSVKDLDHPAHWPSSAEAVARENYADAMDIPDDQWLTSKHREEEHSTPIILRAERIDP